MFLGFRLRLSLCPPDGVIQTMFTIPRLALHKPRAHASPCHHVRSKSNLTARRRSQRLNHSFGAQLRARPSQISLLSTPNLTSIVLSPYKATWTHTSAFPRPQARAQAVPPVRTSIPTPNSRMSCSVTNTRMILVQHPPCARTSHRTDPQHLSIRPGQLRLLPLMATLKPAVITLMEAEGHTCSSFRFS